MDAHRPGLPPGRGATSCEPLQGRGLLLRLGWPPPSLGSLLPRGGVDRRRSHGVRRRRVAERPKGQRQPDRTIQRRRPEGARGKGFPACKAPSRGAAARSGVESPGQSVAGDWQTGCWPEIGPGMGDQEASRSPPQNPKHLEECWLGTGRCHLSEKQDVRRRIEPYLARYGDLALVPFQESTSPCEGGQS